MTRIFKFVPLVTLVVSLLALNLSACSHSAVVMSDEEEALLHGRLDVSSLATEPEEVPVLTGRRAKLTASAYRAAYGKARIVMYSQYAPLSKTSGRLLQEELGVDAEGRVFYLRTGASGATVRETAGRLDASLAKQLLDLAEEEAKVDDRARYQRRDGCVAVFEQDELGKIVDRGVSLQRVSADPRFPSADFSSLVRARRSDGRCETEWSATEPSVELIGRMRSLLKQVRDRFPAS